MPTATTAYTDYLREIARLTACEVVLGSPRDRHCRAFGICRIYVAGELRRCDCAFTLPGRLGLDAPTGRLLLHFANAGIGPVCYRRFFAGGRFRVPDPYSLPPRLTNRLGLPPDRLAIAPGHYPCLEHADYTTLSLRLTRRRHRRPRRLAA